MIEFANKIDIPKIIKLWNEAFGDSKGDIEKFLSVFLEYVLIFRNQDDVAGMLTLLPVTKNNIPGRYVYAVATLKKYRSQGISTRLLDFSKKYIKENNEEFLILVPANTSLFDFYGNRGFKTASYIERKEYKYENFTKKPFDIQKISASEYIALKKLYIPSSDAVCWSEEMLFEIAKLYDGAFYKIPNINVAFFGFSSNNEFFIKELCCADNDVKTVTDAIFTKHHYSKIYAVSKGRTPFAMSYPELNGDIYFSIALD